jgi:hypothetical protein
MDVSVPAALYDDTATTTTTTTTTTNLGNKFLLKN